MKLKRGVPRADLPAFGTSGVWDSADGKWSFSTGSFGRPSSSSVWMISAARTSMSDAEGVRRRQRLLNEFGLYQTDFPTRRAAVAALELMLAGLPEGATG